MRAWRGLCKGETAVKWFAVILWICFAYLGWDALGEIERMGDAAGALWVASDYIGFGMFAILIVIPFLVSWIAVLRRERR